VHELSIAQDTVDAIVFQLSAYPGARVTAVVLGVGRFSAVDPDALAFCFPLACEGTPVDGARLKINPIPLRLECQTCGRSSENAASLVCAHCGSPDVTVTAGRDTIIEAIDLELPDDEGRT